MVHKEIGLRLAILAIFSQFSRPFKYKLASNVSF